MPETTEAKEFRRRQLQGLGKPIDSWERRGIRYVRVNDKVYNSTTWRTFEDFLFDYIKTLMSPEWATPQFAKPVDSRHPLLQWYDRLCAFQKQESEKAAGGIYISPATGAVQAFLNVAYNLYLCAHNNVLPENMLVRMRNEKEFEGALYEVYVLASFLKAGFTIELEDESDSTTSHCEFAAKHSESGRAFSVEAKATTLTSDRSGPGEKPPRIRDKLYKALTKQAAFERIIFIELNRAEYASVNNLPGWLSVVDNELRQAEIDFKIEGDPTAYVFVTNHNYMHWLDSPSQPAFQLAAGYKIPDFPPYKLGLCSMADLVAARTKHAEILQLLDGLNVYARVPSSFDDRTPEEFFGQIDRPQIGQTFWIPNENGLLVQGELISGQVIERDKHAWCQFKTDRGYVLVTFPLTDAEMMAYSYSPETFFGIVQPRNRPITEPHQWYDFLYNTHKDTSKEILLQWVQHWEDFEELEKLDQASLAKVYCERMGTQMWTDGQAGSKIAKDKKPTVHFDLETGQISVNRPKAQFAFLGSNEIFRPRTSTEQAILNEEAKHLLSLFKPGTYTDRDTINSAIQTLFAYHKCGLEEALKKIATRDYITFLLWQYDQSHEVLKEGRKGNLSESQWHNWSTEGPVIRRAFKYLIERVCSLRLASVVDLEGEELLFESEVAQVCAEEFVRLSVMSESTFAIFPKETELTIYPEGAEQLYQMRVLNEQFNALQARIDFDGEHRQRYLSKSGELTLDRNKDEQDRYLGDSFEKAHGLRFFTAIELLGLLIEFENPINKNPFDGCFFHKRELVAALSQHTKLAASMVEKVLSGFTLTSDDIKEKPGQAWNPKRSYGANRRAIFEIPHNNGVCLTWSRCMVREALEALLQGVAFHKFPPEWMTATIKKSLDKLDNDRGKWFEAACARNLVDLGFIGRSWKEKIGSIIIPKDVGEVDYLGYSVAEKRLIFIECKMTQYSSEPRLWRDDLDRYVQSEKNYGKKFRKKRDWIFKNFGSICEIVSASAKVDVAPTSISCAMLTNFPNIASCFISDFPCVSIAELMLATETAKGWPYEIGTYSAPDMASLTKN